MAREGLQVERKLLDPAEISSAQITVPAIQMASIFTTPCIEMEWPCTRE